MEDWKRQDFFRSLLFRSANFKASCYIFIFFHLNKNRCCPHILHAALFELDTTLLSLSSCAFFLCIITASIQSSYSTMFSQPSLRALVAAILIVHPTNAVPQPAPAIPYPDSVLYTWSGTDAQCANSASKADCTAAAVKVCTNRDLTQDYEATVGECTAIYMVDPNNSVPSLQTCTAAYDQILTAGIGGALGYNDAGTRTGDPLYVLYPESDGTGNCFKKTGDTTPVLAANLMPNGQPLGTCPPSSPKEKRALSLLKGRQTPDDNVDDRNGVGECLVEDFLWGGSCSALCLIEAASTSWAGPFAVAGGLACYAGCEAVAWKLYRNCMTNKGSNPDIFGKRSNDHLFDKRASTLAPNPNFVPGGASGNVCIDIKDQLSFSCSAMQISLLSFHQCPMPSTGGTSQGGINF